MPELSAMKGVTQSPPHIYDVWEHTLSVLRYLEGILSSLGPGDSAEEANDTSTGLLTRRLGRYREQFAAHFAESLNTDRSVRGALFFAALYHDIAKPATRSVEESGRIRFLLHESQGADVAADRAHAFNLSTDEVERIRKIIFHHMRFLSLVSHLEEEHEEPSRRAIYRFFRDSGEAGVDLVLLGLADLRGARDHALMQETWATSLDVAHILLESYWEKREETVSPPRLLDGNDLMRELNLPPGKVIGLLLEAIREAQATGQVATREQALDLARAELLKLDPS